MSPEKYPGFKAVHFRWDACTGSAWPGRSDNVFGEMCRQVGQRFWGDVFLILSLETDQGTPPSAFEGPPCGPGGLLSVSDYSRIMINF